MSNSILSEIINPIYLDIASSSITDDESIIIFSIEKIPENEEIFNNIFNTITYYGNPFIDTNCILNFVIIADTDKSKWQYGYTAICDAEFEENYLNNATIEQVKTLKEISYLVPLFDIDIEQNQYCKICIECMHYFEPHDFYGSCYNCVNECMTNNNNYSFFKPKNNSSKEWYNNGGYKLNLCYDENHNYII